MEKDICEGMRSQLTVIGAQILSLRNYATFSDKFSLSSSCSAQGKWSNPQQIASHNGLVALIDEKNELWILDSTFAVPLNITEILRMKAKRVFLGEGQLIFENRRKMWILVNWSGKIDVEQGRMRKVNIHNNMWSNVIDAYFLDEDCEEGSAWYYSTIKKLENTLKIYLINSSGCEIIGFPARKIIKLPEKIAGMSLGKYHGLCWTVSGRIFAWGCKNLAMGLKRYDKGYYDQAQQIKISEPIFKAQAGTNYSIALSVSGNLYEWGISNLGEPILTPRSFSIKNKKFLDLKGFENVFVGLTSANQLFIWGKGMQRYLPCNYSSLDERIYTVPKEKDVKIYDYHVEENCIIALIGMDTGKVNKDQKFYFTQVVRKVSQKYLPHRIKKDEKKNSYSNFKNDMKENEPSIEIVRKNEDYIDRLICNKMNKQEYFMMVQNQPAMFKKIMEEKATRSITRVESWSSIKDHSQNITINKLSKSKILKCHRKVQSARQTPNLTIDIESSNRVIKEIQHEQAELREKRRKLKTPLYKKRQPLTYESRLQVVLQNKCKIEETKREERMQAIEKKMAMAKRQERQAEQVNYAQNKAVVHKLQRHMCKIFLTKLLQGPLELARQIKIRQLISNSNSCALSQNMKTILYQSRAVAFLKTLISVEPKKYELVAKVLVKAVQRWRMKKDKRFRKEIVKEMIKLSIRKRVQEGLSKIWLATRKVQKIAKWLGVQQKQRTLQLKMLWKKSLLLYLKPTPSFENKKPSICKDDLNYKLCSDRTKNPRLTSYLSNSPICHMKLLRKATIRQLEQNHYSSQHLHISFYQPKELCNKKGVSWAESSITDMHFEASFRQERRSITTVLSGPIDILLYSQHYDCFYKPKNYQINIPDNMKQSEKWIIQEKKILNKLIQSILYSQWLVYCQDRKIYQQKLAYFIKENYETLTQCRWKYLIEYNKIKDQNNIQIIKKEKQLRNLLKKINSQHILINDVIPQKYKIVDYAKHMKGSPTPPSLDIFLSQNEFKRQFKVYYEGVSNKAKYLRKFYN